MSRSRHVFVATLVSVGLMAITASLPARVLLAADPPKVELVASSEPNSPEKQQSMFRLPEGFQIELVACEPDVPKPINMNFDAAGRLFVTCSLEYPFPKDGGGPGRDTIKMLTDTNGDGRPDKVSTAVDGLNIPIGVLPLAGPTGAGRTTLGYGIPSIKRFTDTDGDGLSDKTESLYESFGFKDTHGMASSFTWGLDGWVYACHGFANESKVAGNDGQAIAMQSGNSYRFRPDGSHIEYFTHGQVNPFGLVFDHLGNLYSADCHSRPIYMLLRGGYYPSFGKPHDGLGYAPEMIAHSHGSTGICGLTYYDAAQFPPSYRGTMFIGNPVTGRVNHDRLEQRGAGYQAVELPDFLTCDDPWFRPVDLKLGPDGALYIADFYNKIIGHYEVPLTHPQRDRERGRIWRVSYVWPGGGPAKAGPNLAIADKHQLVASLGSHNITLRTHATHQLVERIGVAAFPLLRGSFGRDAKVDDDAVNTRAHALWVFERLGGLDAGLVADAAHDPSPVVRTHLARALGSRPRWTANERGTVEPMLTDTDPFVRRNAADALGAHPDGSSISKLVAAIRNTAGDDAHGLHVLRMALRDHLSPLGRWGGELSRAGVTESDFGVLLDVVLGVRTPGAAAFLAGRLAGLSNDARFGDFCHHVARHTADGGLPKLPEGLLQHRGTLSSAATATLLRGTARGYAERGVPFPEALIRWGTDEAQVMLAKGDAGEVRGGLEFARELRLNAAIPAIRGLIEPTVKFPELVEPATDALAALDPAVAIPLQAQFVADATRDVPFRQRMAERVGGTNSEAARGEVEKLWSIVPESVSLALARGLAGSREGGRALVEAAERGKFSPRVLKDPTVAAKLANHKQSDLDAKVAGLVKDLPKEDERLAALLEGRRQGFSTAKGDAARGKQVFAKHCANCHKLGGEGAKVGPELDGVGIRGVDRLLEDTLLPSRNVDQEFRARVYELKDGTQLTGLLLRKEGEVDIVADQQGKEIRVPANQVEESAVVLLSAMPANVAELMSEAEYFDLLAHLLKQTVKPAADGKK
jgi:putative heme-binding domain-containing protein